VKPTINSVEVHPQLSNNGYPMDGALVGAGSLWPRLRRPPPPPLWAFFSSLWIIDEMVQMVLEGGRSLYLKASGIK